MSETETEARERVLKWAREYISMRSATCIPLLLDGDIVTAVLHGEAHATQQAEGRIAAAERSEATYKKAHEVAHIHACQLVRQNTALDRAARRAIAVLAGADVPGLRNAHDALVAALEPVWRGVDNE